MQTDKRLDRALLLATLLAECLQDCPDVESVFLGFNQNIYLCGDHDQHSLGSLHPAGKTNEAAALQYLRENCLMEPRRRKVVVVLSDGLPTACSQESVCALVRSLENDAGVRLMHVGFSSEQHPAYRRQITLAGACELAEIHRLGRMLGSLLE
jgi:hypothetical protein